VSKYLLKFRAKSALAVLGVRVRPGGAPRRDILGAVRHLARLGFSPATVIDVGVADGTFELYETFPAAKHLLIEPLEEFRDCLDYIQRRYGAEFVVAAADDHDGTTTIFVGEDLHGASVLADEHREASREITAVTLDRLCAERRVEPPVLVKVDVQGGEFRVLDGAHDLLQLTEVVILETSLFRFRPESIELGDAIQYMAARGFVPYDLVGAYTRPLDGALAQVDVVFVAEGSSLRADSRFSSEAQQARHLNSTIWRARRRLGL